ncbi:hypothetical protein N665_0226s0026 [Sinapis alba]|nr:hypothetical protein N665_0226s0026 [Sinapis alba]
MRAKRKKSRPPSALAFKVSGLIRSARQAASLRKMNMSLSLAVPSEQGVAACGFSNPGSSSSYVSVCPVAGSVSALGGSLPVPEPNRTSLVLQSPHPVSEAPPNLSASAPFCTVSASSSTAVSGAGLSSGQLVPMSIPPVMEASLNRITASSTIVPLGKVPAPSTIATDGKVPPYSTLAADGQAPASSLTAPNQVQNFASLLKSSVQLQVLGSPTEHVSGAPFVFIPDENIEAAKREFKDFVYARFHGDYPSMGKIIGVVNAVWAKTGPRIFVHNIGQGIYLLRVSNPRAREVLLSRTCWNIGGLPMFVAPWSPEYSPDQPPLTSATVPVELRNVPYLLFNCESLSRIATAVGKPESLFPETERKENFAVAKLYVRVDLTAPLPHRIISGFSNGKEVQIDVSYPWLPVKCETCKKFGHSRDKCSGRSQSDPPVQSSPNKVSTEKARRRSKSRPGRSMDKKSKKVESRYVPIVCEGEAVPEAIAIEKKRPTDKVQSTLEEGEIDENAVVVPNSFDSPALLVSEVIPAPSDEPIQLSGDDAIALKIQTPKESTPDTLNNDGFISTPPSELSLTVSPSTRSLPAIDLQCQESVTTIVANDSQSDGGTTLSVPTTNQRDIPPSAGELEREKPFFLVKNRKSGRKVTNRH